MTVQTQVTSITYKQFFRSAPVRYMTIGAISSGHRSMDYFVGFIKIFMAAVTASRVQQGVVIAAVGVVAACTVGFIITIVKRTFIELCCFMAMEAHFLSGAYQ